MLTIPKTVTELDKKAIDFYTTYDPFETKYVDKEDYNSYLQTLNNDELELLNSNKNYYEIQFSNIGGLVMPIILEFNYLDGSSEVIRIPAEIWKRNSNKVKKVFILDKEISSVTLDPFLETADVQTSNNYWPPRIEPTRFQLFKQNTVKNENLMQRDLRSREMINSK